MGEALTSYAADINLNDQNRDTNVSNVKFDLYFDATKKDEKEIEKDINTEDLQLFVSVEVKDGGYLSNGQIDFADCNFRLKNNQNKIELDSIQSGKNKEFYVEIEAKKDDLFNLNLLNMASKIKLTGEYINNAGEKEQIDTEKQVRISWTSDNITDENNPIKLNQKVITNKIYNIDGTNKRVIQLEVTSGLENNQYPIKSTEIELNVPALGELYPEDVVVASYDTIATNGKSSIEFEKVEENTEIEKEESKLGIWTYNEDEHKVNIVVNNKPVENKVNWAKSGEDTFIVTYVYEENADLANFASSIKSKISLYETKNAVLEDELVLSKENMEEIENAIIANLKGQDVIYKSNMNIGKETEYEEEWTIGVGYSELANSFIVANDEDKLVLTDGESESEQSAITYYESTYINKEEFLNMFGENKEIILYYINEEGKGTEKTITINSDTEADEEGNICLVNYEDNVIMTSIGIIEPISEGKLNIKHKKVLKTEGYNIEEINQIIKLKSVMILEAYNKVDNELDNELGEKVVDTSATNLIDMVEPETEVAIGVDKEKLSTTQKNNINLTVTLKEDNLKYRLYKNPVIEIELPREVKSVNVKEPTILNEEQTSLTIKGKEIIENDNGNKIIKITLEGEQTEYIGQDVQVLVNLDLQTTKLMPTEESFINVKCTNGEEVAQNYCSVKFVSEQGILLANSISNYNNEEPEIKVFKNETKTGLLSADSEEITATGKSTIVNNTGDNLASIIVIGKNSVQVTMENAEIYYTKDAEVTLDSNWAQEYSDDVTGYKVVLNSLEKGEVLEIPYNLKIPAELGTDKSIELGYSVYNGIIKLEQSPKIVLETVKEGENETPGENEIPGENQTPEENEGEQSNDAKLEITMTSNPDSTKELELGDNITYTINVKNLSSVERRVIIDGTMPKGLEVESATISFKGINDKTGKVEQILEELPIYTEQYFETINEVLAEDTVTITIIGHVIEAADVQEITNKVKAIIKLPNETGLEEDEEKCYVGKVETEVTHKVIQYIPLDDIEIPEEITVKIGEKKNLEIKLVPENAQTDNLEITVDDSEIATVTKEGVVEGIAEGSTVISIFTEDRSISKNCRVNVVEEKQETEKPDSPDTPENPEQNPVVPENPEQDSVAPEDPEQTETYKISGIAWLDENKDGKKEETEKLLKEIIVKIKNAKTNEYLKKESGEQIIAKTDKNGVYTFENLQSGKYIIEFEYNTNTYGLTPVVGKDSIANIVTTEGITVITTDILTLQSKDITNANIGLVLNPEFDLQLDKYVSKITVQNTAGTTTYNYNKEQLAKVDIKAKQMEGSTVIIEYTFAVTNKGDVPGYAKTIVDYVSPELKFSSELNTSWYEGSDKNLYCIELADEIINPGETKEIKLILTKTMTAKNTGLVNNTAEIYEDFNEYALEDTNSEPANKEQKENDMSAADVIITVSTGSAILYIGIILTCMLILGGGIYIINRKVICGKKLI